MIGKRKTSLARESLAKKELKISCERVPRNAQMYDGTTPGHVVQRVCEFGKGFRVECHSGVPAQPGAKQQLSLQHLFALKCSDFISRTGINHPGNSKKPQ